MMRHLIILILFCLFISCNETKSRSEILTDNTAKVLVFLAPDCPLCKNYTKDLKAMQATYGHELDFYGVVPGKFYTKHEVDSFLNYYDLNLEIIYDPYMNLTKEVNATITPEAYLIDENNQIIYQGLLDNWLGELGRRRQVITEYYLNDAIDSYLKGNDIKIKKTKAIGCFIE
jgi:thiol-disulfide isomerase/thioredoxin